MIKVLCNTCDYTDETESLRTALDIEDDHCKATGHRGFHYKTMLETK